MTLSDPVPLTPPAGATPGPPAGFEAFFRHFEPMICRYLIWREADRNIVEDAAQLTLLSAYRYWEKVGDMADPRGWLFRVAGQRLEDARQDRERGGILTDPQLLRSGDANEDHLAACEQHLDIVTAVRKLPPRQQEALALRVQGGFGFREIAQTMGCAEGTARGHVHQARTTLAAILGDTTADGGVG
ncbi:RNA polymerase sigma factor [Streptomyces sp. NPDC001549]|uniref:RNA polymerase sigma factor n=1 Tax=Streptomyces sp. NPDC001549 TaxID=3364586 RepID=UPI003678F3CB